MTAPAGRSATGVAFGKTQDTDGRIYYVPHPKGGLFETKTFSSRDGLGIRMAHAAGLKTGIITGRGSPVIEHRVKELGIHYLQQNALDKIKPFGFPAGVEPGLAIVAVEAAIALVVILISLQHGRRLAPVLGAAQLAIAVWLEATGRMPGFEPDRLFGFDRLSMVMVLIVGIIGTLICVLAWMAGPMFDRELGPFDLVINFFYAWEKGMNFRTYWTPQVPTVPGAVHSLDYLVDYAIKEKFDLKISLK